MARVVKPEGRVLIIDYRSGSLRMKGYIARSLSTVAERIAGRDHYRNWRRYLRSGGIPSMATEAGLSVEREKIVAGGNLALWLLKSGD
jgi:ubiquinone/menaquinone biosynthesis C-methylase UbiE